MARENRTCRRMLARSLMDLMQKTKGSIRATRIVKPIVPGDPHYIFLLVPHLSDLSEPEYRNLRIGMLESCCIVLRYMIPDATDIVGIGMETDAGELTSEDALYFDGREWTPEMEEEARRIQGETGLLTNIKAYSDTVNEYPDPESELPNSASLVVGKNPRNKPCPCGSGKKYKKCHGA